MTKISASAADRASPDALERQIEIAASFSVSSFFADYPEPAIIVNAHRQIVWTNAAARRLADGQELSLLVESAEPPQGLAAPGFSRPGEFWGCVHAKEAPGGCGAAASCAFCSVGRCFCQVLEGSMQFGDSGSLLFRECSMERLRDGRKDTLEFELWMKPVEKDGESLVFVAFKDISQGKRRRALERIFFHDVLNTATGIATWLELSSANLGQAPAYLESAKRSVERLVEEIQSQRTLSKAEDGELEPEIYPVSAGEILEETTSFCRAFSENREIAVRLRAEEPKLVFYTDKVLLRRVLVNLVKNAIEASFRGQEVVCEARRVGSVALAPPEAAANPALPDGGIEFAVRNEGTLSPEQKARIFQRSYSTKGANRGLGTYGALLLTERYLKGRIEFESSPESGTAFRVTLPLVHPLSPLYPKGE